ncbi:class 1 fructose-bisphosphatase [Algisphaera agarilytica]|uniref:Fructose-1,6-bisphosphatase class 1 n=1 Tax=Algisphaera agarilytica TaxID=1385975 RepID=A0A7X0LM07_9BACT|nr:class 1 fructose-bisphosphatase [Algisphaera agarilytica]MBB6431459.1 fructose-1,6-bisphosphatase I [Algisphaera agarilytica]
MAIKKDGDFVTFTQFIQDEQKKYPGVSGRFSWMMSGVALATRMIGSYIRRAGLIDVWGEHGTTNVQGEVVKKLDIMANDALKRTLGYRGNVGIIASEEDNEPRVLQEVDEEDSYIVMFDPLDGSSNIDVNVSVGTIFTVFKNPPAVVGAEQSVLQPGAKQVAAGYVLYGSSTVLVYTAGSGTHMFTLDPQFGTYLLTRENIQMPKHAPQYSVNEAYSHTFPEGYRRYLDWVKLQDSPIYSSRYVGSLVADFHRILIKGGVYMYPPTSNDPQGKLRLMYECNPLAFIAEQAGGLATAGDQRIMDIKPTDVHERVPFIIGSQTNVEEVLRYAAPKQTAGV